MVFWKNCLKHYVVIIMNFCLKHSFMQTLCRPSTSMIVDGYKVIKNLNLAHFSMYMSCFALFYGNKVSKSYLYQPLILLCTPSTICFLTSLVEGKFKKGEWKIFEIYLWFSPFLMKFCITVCISGGKKQKFTPWCSPIQFKFCALFFSCPIWYKRAVWLFTDTQAYIMKTQ